MRRGPPAGSEGAPGIVVGVGRLLGRAFGLRNVAQVDPDARPGAGPAAHRVDQDVVFLQERRNLGMASLPAFEAGESVLLVPRVGDRDERLRRLTPAAAF